MENQNVITAQKLIRSEFNEVDIRDVYKIVSLGYKITIIPRGGGEIKTKSSTEIMEWWNHGSIRVEHSDPDMPKIQLGVFHDKDSDEIDQMDDEDYKEYKNNGGELDYREFMQEYDR